MIRQRDLIDENVVQQWLELRPYLIEALKLAQSIRKGSDEQYRKSGSFSHLNGSTRDSIESVSEELFSEIDLSSEEDLLWRDNWTAIEVRAFLKRHRRLQQKIQDKSILEGLEKRYKRANLYKGVAEKLMRYADIAHRSPYLNVHIPPIDWIALLITAVPAFFGAMARFKAAENNPDFVSCHVERSQSVLTMIFVTSAVIAIPLIIFASGPIAVGAAAFFVASGTLAVAANSLISLSRSIIDVIKEITYHKEPKETHLLRVFRKLTACVKHASSVVFYICISILAVAAVVALFTNPIGLGVLASAITTIALVTLGITIGATLCSKLAKRRIDHIERTELASSKLHRSERKPMARSIVKPRTELLQSLKSALQTDKKSAFKGGLYLMREIAASDSSFSMRAVKQILHEDYLTLNKASVDDLKRKQKTQPIYKGITYRDHYQKGTDQEGLMVNVPKSELRHASVKNDDKMERYRNADKEVEISLSHHPSDRSIFIMLDVNKALAPLTMEYCRDLTAVLKILEAAKLADIEIIVDAKNREQFINHVDPMIRQYFLALEHISAKEFASYMEARAKKDGITKLGEIPNALPEGWKKPQNHY
jgi:hypothetical protein